jgi:hypothetical protein
MAMFDIRRVRNRDTRISVLVVAAIVALAWSAWTAITSSGGEGADHRATPDPRGRVVVSATIVNPRLVATRALTDFGPDVGARYVAVRILAEVDLEVHLIADADMVLATYPRLCLIGPFSMPGYAGLSDACWGAPDLGPLLRAHLMTDADGRPVLRAGREVTLRATLARDAERCDYPPGRWQLEVEIDRLIEGAASSPVAIASVELNLPAKSAGPLPLVKRTHYCGIANVVFREQGEPELAPG